MIERLREEDVFVSERKFPMEVWGVVYFSSHSTYHIGINDRLPDNQKEKVLDHELNHIKNDLPNHAYIIGLDMQHTELEQEADQLASVF